ncbi:hypothetical protein BX266_0119 [Streptomyces sp. TLI_171]|nr:hypothetical protein BX266_0119 [Streptomyces sp. TLI_171]
MAARSGVHVATIYRRWRTADGLIIDTVVEELGRRSPLPATGDLRADLLTWTGRLLADVREPGHLAFFRAMLRAGGQGEHGLDFAEPRIRQLQATLDASGTTVLTWADVFELILSPAYVRALLAFPMDPRPTPPAWSTTSWRSARPGNGRGPDPARRPGTAGEPAARADRPARADAAPVRAPSGGVDGRWTPPPVRRVK